MIWHQTDYWKLFWCKDFAGGTVVHMSAGFAALAGVLVLGKEKTRTHSYQYSVCAFGNRNALVWLVWL
jgi:ammonia channel protein AmtB